MPFFGALQPIHVLLILFIMFILAVFFAIVIAFVVLLNKRSSK